MNKREGMSIVTDIKELHRIKKVVEGQLLETNKNNPLLSRLEFLTDDQGQAPRRYRVSRHHQHQ